MIVNLSITVKRLRILILTANNAQIALITDLPHDLSLAYALGGSQMEWKYFSDLPSFRRKFT